MSTTLTNGLKLPDKGSVDWYADMQNNYTILDGAVGTVAEHTTALAGKAPLVHTHTKSDVTDLLNSNFIPSANNSYDLGSSSYQWKSVYAQSYYYNGTAWGLDKQNEWTNFQRMTSNPAAWYLRNTTVTLGTAPSSNRYLGTFFEDVNGGSLGYTAYQANKNGENSIQFNVANSDGTNTYTAQMRLKLGQDGSSAFIPEVNNATDLGTSTNKWKTLNGINPGALSLPDIYDSYDVVTTNWSTAYNQPNDLKINGADPSYPGWLFIRLDNCTAADDFVIVRYFHVNATNLTFFGSFIPTASSYVLSVPIQAGITTKVWVSKIPTTCKYYACLGTVK